MGVYNRTSAELAVGFFNTRGQPVTPTIARYRVLSGETGAELFPWTSFSPDDSAEIISLPSEINTFLDAESEVETRVVQLAWQYEQGGALRDAADTYSYSIYEIGNDPTQQKLTGSVSNPVGSTPLARVQVEAQVQSPVVNNKLMPTFTVIAETNEDGFYTLFVPKGAKILLKIIGIGVFSFTVTDDDARDTAEYINDLQM